MHAYLFIGTQIIKNQEPITKLAESLDAKIMEFPLIKIEDVRSLNNLIRLKFNEPTLIICNNIHEASEEALNAFLKNLEEPQINVYFVLTAPSIHKVLPTITSRCQVIKFDSNFIFQSENLQEIEKFWKMKIGEKISYVDNIKDREAAIEFTEKLAFFIHRSLGKKELKYKFSAKEGEITLKTLSRLKANGNVNLQLSNLVVQLSKK